MAPGLRCAISSSPFQSDAGGLINIPAVVIIVLVSVILIRGIRESASVNNVIVALKITVLLVFIAVGWSYMQPANHTPLIPPNEGGFGKNLRRAVGNTPSRAAGGEPNRR